MSNHEWILKWKSVAEALGLRLTIEEWYPLSDGRLYVAAKIKPPRYLEQLELDFGGDK